MKNTIYALSMLAMVLSCAKEGVADEAGVSGGTSSDVPVQPLVKYESQFSALVDSSEVSTKTFFDAADGNMLKWTSDDEILVSNGTKSMSYFITEGGGTNAKLYFTTGEDLTGDAFYAVYPASGAAYSNGTYQVTIPATQAYTEGNFAQNSFPMVGACGPVKALQFKNAGAVVAIRPVSALGASSKITSIVITANEPLVGACSVQWNGGMPSVTCTGGKTLTINCGEGIAWGTTVYACVAPGTYTDFKVTVNYTNSTGSAHYTMRGNYVLNRSKLKKLTIDFTDVVECQDLSVNGTANCYLITNNTGAKYRFPITVKGNGQTIPSRASMSTRVPLEDIEALYVYYQNGIGKCATTMFEVEPYLSGDYICFQTKTIANFTEVGNTDSSADAGNALIAVSSTSNWEPSLSNIDALWSWHIWYCPAVNDHNVPALTGKYSTVLNIDLGGRGTGYYGKSEALVFYYQFGRKDPLSPPDSDAMALPFVSNASKSTLENAILHPQMYFGNKDIDWCSETEAYDWWNANQTTANKSGIAIKKTMFDPCPPGYHVMSHEVLDNFVSMAKNTNTTDIRASGTSVGFGGDWNVNFPAYGDRRPSLSTFSARVHRYTTLARHSDKGGSAETAYFAAAKSTSISGDYAVDANITTTSFTRAIATPIRCQKQQ
ncbi:MAG: hypothetical protein IIX64_04480 [Bacteroidales bacterium]|nr:hypothetical protein [Bacteroidales bacterium]